MMDLDEFLQSGIDHARRVLVGQPGAELMPAFVVQFNDRPPAIIGAPWSGDDEKEAVVAAMRLSLKVFRSHIVSYLFWSEAWMATEDRRHPTGLQPRDREDKQEVVIVSAYAKDGGRMVMLEVMRGPDGVITELKQMGQAYDRLEGRLHNLLNDD